MRRTDRETVLRLDQPGAPPYWALLERELLARQAEACRAFFTHYFDDRGYLLCVPRWGGNDGPDDAAENLLNWTMLHALGGPDDILELYRKGWEGHLRQYTEAKTTEVPFARDGMYYKEFPVSLDWFHHGEGFSPFFLQGLSTPGDPEMTRRHRAYAGLYMGDDPAAPNYDPRHRIIRSMLNGSRGPMLRQATAVDWAGDPIEVEGRFSPLHNERTYEEMLLHFEQYTDVVGDHPLNLGATQLALNAYAATGEARYRDWLLEYADAWAARTAENGGIIPSNVGLDGTIGGAYGGNWWAGCYGWGFTVPVVPLNGQMSHRPGFHNRSYYGFANALLVTGQRKWVDVWRTTLDRVNEQVKEIDGRTQYPRMHGAEGWYDYRPEKFAAGALELWYWTLDRSALELMPERPAWVRFLDGEEPEYPVRALQAELDSLRRRIEQVRQDKTTPDTRLSDDPNHLNPATTERLTELMLGGLPTGREGYALHCRVRYFDPSRRRAGLPPDVGALVDRMTEDEVGVQLANTNPISPRSVVVQGGAYAEHQLLRVTVDGQTVPVEHSHVLVELAPGAVGRIVLKMRRYANQPTFAFPWA